MRDLVAQNLIVDSNQGQTLKIGLSDQHAIEWVLVNLLE